MAKPRKIRNTKAKGNRREYQVRDWYMAQGWEVARAAASLKIDITATLPDEERCDYVSVKANAWPPAEEWETLRRLAERCSNGGSKFRVWVIVFYDRKGVKIASVGPNGKDTILHVPKLSVDIHKATT